MPLQNRVDPEGNIHFSPARGTFMGNRGCLHTDAKEIRRTSKRDAWVTCLLEFKDRQRVLMEPGKYTELFFLDEATALAAGHRPCATCRPLRYKAFMAAWGSANQPGVAVKPADVDAQLKQDRKPLARERIANLNGLPEGVMVKHIANGTIYLLHAGKAYPWSFQGYAAASAPNTLQGPFLILTPASTVATLRQGYRPELHPSAR